MYDLKKVQVIVGALIVMYTLDHLLDQIMVGKIPIGRRRFENPYL